MQNPTCPHCKGGRFVVTELQLINAIAKERVILCERCGAIAAATLDTETSTAILRILEEIQSRQEP